MINFEKLKKTPIKIELEADMFTFFLVGLVIQSQMYERATKPVSMITEDGVKINLPPMDLTPMAKDACQKVAGILIETVVNFYTNERKNGSPN